MSHRILLVSSTTVGGSGRSQRELAIALDKRGCTTSFLVDDGERRTAGRRLLEELTDATVKLSSAPLGRTVDTARGLVGRRTRKVQMDGIEMEATIAPENAVAEVLARDVPDVVVASSISRVTWRAVRAECRLRNIPTVLYLREETAIGHLTAGLFADLTVANSASLVASAALYGVEAHFVPSLVQLMPSEIEPTCEVALMVNPIETHGVGLIDAMADSLPHIPFVLQESWRLDAYQQATVDALARNHRNVSFRAFEPVASRIFRDAKVLLAPHRIDNRPRIVLEAQVNGLPVLAAGHPGLIEAVGAGGVLLEPGAGPEDWVDVLIDIWDDETRMAVLSERARRHAARPDIRPDHVVNRFMELLGGLTSPEMVR